jgi:Ankyrin repeats (3 copies)/Ankyrin repeat
MKIKNVYISIIFLMFSQSIYGMDLSQAIPDYGSMAQLKQFIEAGGNINATDKCGLTALHIAVGWGNSEMVKYLISKGADINAQDREGGAALYRAVVYDDLALVKYLLENGADIDARDKHGWTALHKAAYDNNDKIGQILILNGADIHVKRGNGKTALDLSYGCGAMREILRKYSTLEQEARTEPTSKLLKQAIQNSQYGIVKAILETRKVYPTQKDIEIAKARWLKTKDFIYNKIGKILISYYGPWNSLLKGVGISLTESELPKELVAKIGGLVNYDLLEDEKK